MKINDTYKLKGSELDWLLIYVKPSGDKPYIFANKDRVIGVSEDKIIIPKADFMDEVEDLPEVPITLPPRPDHKEKIDTINKVKESSRSEMKELLKMVEELRSRIDNATSTFSD